jgi:hypothetical protein
MVPYRLARRWYSVTPHTGSLCRPCTTRGGFSHAGLSPVASSSPLGSIVHQLKSTMSRAIGGCGFRAICLPKVDSLDSCIRWAARFCRRSRECFPESTHHRAAKVTHSTHSIDHHDDAQNATRPTHGLSTFERNSYISPRCVRVKIPPASARHETTRFMYRVYMGCHRIQQQESAIVLQQSPRSFALRFRRRD